MIKIVFIIVITMWGFCLGPGCGSDGPASAVFQSFPGVIGPATTTVYSKNMTLVVQQGGISSGKISGPSMELADFFFKEEIGKLGER